MPDICFSATRPARFSKWSGAAMLALKCLVLPWTLSNQAIPDHPTWYRFQESWVFGPDAQPPQLQPKCKLIWINSAYWKDSIQRNIKCSGWTCPRSLCIEWFARCATSFSFSDKKQRWHVRHCTFHAIGGRHRREELAW